MTSKEAVEHLRDNQAQLDMDGVMVQVSRQALDQALDGYDALSARVAELEATQPETVVEVKPLVWVDVYRNGTRFEPMAYGLPAISMAGDGTWYWNGGNYPTPDAAMKAAEPLNQKAVLSAITITPNADAIREAMENVT